MNGSSWVTTATAWAGRCRREVGGDVALDLRFAAAQCDEHGEGQQFAGRQVEAGAGAWSPKQLADRYRWMWLSSGASAYMASTASAPTICFCTARPLRAGLRSGGGLRRQRQLDAAVGEHLVGDVQEVETLAMPTYGHRLVHDLLGLDRCDPDGERGPEHDPVFAERLAAMMAASCTINRVRVSRLPYRRTSSNAKLSNTSISSGSVTASVDTWPGNSSSWCLRGFAVVVTVGSLV